MGRLAGSIDQQRFIMFHKSSETRLFAAFPFGRGGDCILLILAWMTAASRECSWNGIFSVTHSNINIANEYESELSVGSMLLFWMSSGAEYLIGSPAAVMETESSLFSLMIFAIPKSQICGSPLPTYGQLAVYRIWAREFTF